MIFLKKLNYKFILSFIFLFIIQSFAYAKNTIENIDKNIAEWTYFINGHEMNDSPEIFLGESAKYFPIEIIKNLGLSYVLDYKNRKAYLTNNEESFEIKENSKQIYINNKYYNLPNEVIWKNNTFYLPASFITKLNASIGENKYKNQVNIFKTLNTLNSINSNVDVSETKIIFNFSSQPVFEEEKGNDYYKISILGTNLFEKDKIKKQLESISSEFSKIDLDFYKGITKIIFYTKEEFNLINTYTIEKPDRLVIQFPKNYKTETKLLKQDGIYHSKIVENNSSIPNKINILEIDPQKNISIKPVISRDKYSNFNLKELSKLAKDFNALAGINGGYFSSKIKSPLGLLLANGELIAQPWYNRSSLIINKDNSFEIKNIDLNIFLKISNFQDDNNSNPFDSSEVVKPINIKNDKSIKVNSYNLPPKEDQIVVFNYNFMKSYYNKNLNPLKKDKEQTYFFIDPKTNEIKYNPEENIKGFYVYAEGKGKENLDKYINQNIKCEVVINYSEPINNVLYAIGGGPTLIKNGLINITSEQEKFKADITDGKAPRTALGLLNNNKILIIVVDGRQKTSKGMTLDEVANYLKKYNVISAINFDGGGSSSMYLDGKIINSFSDNKERVISNGLFIFDKE
ncbi:MAG: phosphodiester glycosidase family protein [Cyanobacteriota bacterium]